jgi:hypothetical protein
MPHVLFENSPDDVRYYITSLSIYIEDYKSEGIATYCNLQLITKTKYKSKAIIKLLKDPLFVHGYLC